MKWLFVILSFLFFSIPQILAAPATLDDYWNGKAEWKLRNRMTQGNYAQWQQGYTNQNFYGFGAGSHFYITPDGTWYHFSRKINWGQKPSYCQNINETFGIQIRKSTDHGFTWSLPADVITPTQGTPWECGATDGDVIFEPSTQMWTYLFQCFNSQSLLARLFGNTNRL